MLFAILWQQVSWLFFLFSYNGKMLFYLLFESPKSCLIMRLMVFGTISISQAMIFWFWTRFWLILDLTALIAYGIWTTRGQPNLLQSLTPPVSKTNLTVRYTKTNIIFNGFSNSKIWALFIPHLCRAMTAIRFSLSVDSIITAQTKWNVLEHL
jgi:hypothetical protein